MLDQEARAIQRLFEEVRQSYCPGACGFGAKHYHHFVKAAKLARELKEAPAVFVMRQAEEMAEIGKWYPQGLYSRKVAIASRSKLVTKTSGILALYKFQLELFRARMKISPPDFALRDSSEPFTPLFRCCAALNCDLPEVVNTYREAARLELAAFPFARDIFGSIVDRL